MAKSFGEKLKEFRTKAGMSQGELAEKTGITQSAISLWERGERDPNWTAVKTLAQALGITCLDFDDEQTRGVAVPISEPPPDAMADEPKRKTKRPNNVADALDGEAPLYDDATVPNRPKRPKKGN